jgi:hypothetical protein
MRAAQTKKRAADATDERFARLVHTSVYQNANPRASRFSSHSLCSRPWYWNGRKFAGATHGRSPWLITAPLERSFPSMDCAHTHRTMLIVKRAEAGRG